jgi:hypothetical protein
MGQKFETSRVGAETSLPANSRRAHPICQASLTPLIEAWNGARASEHLESGAQVVGQQLRLIDVSSQDGAGFVGPSGRSQPSPPEAGNAGLESW